MVLRIVSSTNLLHFPRLPLRSQHQSTRLLLPCRKATYLPPCLPRRKPVHLHPHIPPPSSLTLSPAFPPPPYLTHATISRSHPDPPRNRSSANGSRVCLNPSLHPSTTPTCPCNAHTS